MIAIQPEKESENVELNEQAQKYADDHHMHYLKTNLINFRFNRTYTLDLLSD